MARKVFISFLGTGKYEATTYLNKSDDSSFSTKFVQVAINKLILGNITSDMQRFILMTTESALQNEDELGNCMRQENFNYTKIIVPSGNNDDIWSLFSKVIELFEETDEVYFDITHGFRLQPLLALVILNYARFVKNIEVKGIYYGAFVRDVKITPIIDVLPLYELLLWTDAAQSVVQTGDVTIFAKKIIAFKNDLYKKPEFNNLKQTPNFKDLSDTLKRVHNYLINYYNSVKIVDSNFISKLDFTLIEDELEKLKQVLLTHDVLPPATLIVDKLKDVLISKHKSNYFNNQIFVIKQQLGYYNIQSSITLLRELYISYFTEKLGYVFMGEESEEIREKVSSTLALIAQESEIPPALNSIYHGISSLPNFNETSRHFSSIIQYRNNINHAFTGSTNSNIEIFANSGDKTIKIKSTIENALQYLEDCILN